jgi:hypothetical protein
MDCEMFKEVTKITLINQPNINPQLLGVTICCFHHFQMQIKAFLLYMAIVRIMDTPHPLLVMKNHNNHIEK